MLLLRMTVGSWAPLWGILDPALWSVHWKAAFSSAFIGGAVGIEKVLTVASELRRKTFNRKPNGIKPYPSGSRPRRKKYIKGS